MCNWYVIQVTNSDAIKITRRTEWNMEDYTHSWKLDKILIMPTTICVWNSYKIYDERTQDCFVLRLRY